MVWVKKGCITALKQVCNKLISKIHRFWGEFASFSVGKQRAENLDASPPFICTIIHSVTRHSLSLSALNAWLTHRISGYAAAAPAAICHPVPLTMTLSPSHCPSQSLSFIVRLPLSISPRGINLSLLASSCFVFPRASLAHPPDKQ